MEAGSQDLLSVRSSRSSAVDHVEGISLRSSRKRQDAQVAMSEIARKEMREKRRRCVETGTGRRNGDAGNQSRFGLGGKRRRGPQKGKVASHEREQVKKSRRQREAPGEEGEEIKSPKRKVIRVESEETQDYVKEAEDMDQEEGEEISSVSSAISVPQKPLFRCDNQCSEKNLSFWQFASVVTKEAEASHQCYNKYLNH